MTRNEPLILVRGGGDLATGVAARLRRCGFAVAVTEIEHPLAVRRLVSVAEAVYAGEVQVEDIHAAIADDPAGAKNLIHEGSIPVLVDPSAEARRELAPAAMIDARMLKSAPELGMDSAPLVIGLGPGFEAGINCHAVVETQRGPRLGRVVREGPAAADTGVPDPMDGIDAPRVLRAPASGKFHAVAEIGTLVAEGQPIGQIGSANLEAPFEGALRGLIYDGIEVQEGSKIGDLDPRGDLSLCTLISDKALAVGGGVLEAVLSQPKIRAQLAG